MTRSMNLRAAPAVAVFAAAAVAAVTLVAFAAATPAGAVSIKHTNRAGGDPDQASIPVGHTAPPADTTGGRMFDKAHEAGNR